MGVHSALPSVCHEVGGMRERAGWEGRMVRGRAVGGTQHVQDGEVEIEHRRVLLTNLNVP